MIISNKLKFISHIDKLLRRRGRCRLRSIMRGYFRLKKTDKVGLIRWIKNDLVDCHFTKVRGKVSKSMFGASVEQAELVIRQFLLQRNTGAMFIKAILFSIGKQSASVIYPLPREWQTILIKHGLQVNRSLCSLAWMTLVFLYWNYGIILFFKFAMVSFLKTHHSEEIPYKRYAYFDGLTVGNLPHPVKDKQSHDVCTWYSQWSGRADNLDALCHGVFGAGKKIANNIEVEYMGQPFLTSISYSRIVLFLGWGFLAIALSAFDALRGRWWHALILSESMKAKLVQLCDPRYIAVDYLFHYSGTVYRPIWTYEAQKKEARIICYFYSTSEQVKLPDGYESQRYDWGAASWPQYLVWDQYQADIIRRDIDTQGLIEIVGPIWFTDSEKDLPEIPVKSIAVFDIQPHRESVHFGITTLADFVAKYPEVHIRFLHDIHTVLSECGVTMAFKKKRDIGNKSEVRYKSFVHKLSQSRDVAMVDPSISAIKVIEGCKGVISMPFTSTAFYLRDHDIPSAYYDPTGWIQKDDRGAHGIPILSGIEELRIWVVSIFKDFS